MADLTDFGIVSIDTALTKQFRRKRSAQVSGPVLTSGGGFHAARAYGIEDEIQASGDGDLPADFALGGAGPTIAGLTGGVTLVEQVDERQNNEGYNEWESRASHAPSAA